MMIQVLSPEWSAVAHALAKPDGPPLLFAFVLAFLKWPWTLPAMAVSAGCSAATWEWAGSRKAALTAGLATAGSLAAYLVLLISSLCTRASEPSWWEVLCIVLGWVAGLAVLALTGDEWGVGALVAGVVGGYAFRYLCQYILGPWLIFPLIKYVLGYTLSVLLVLALVLLWGVVLWGLGTSKQPAQFLAAPFGYFVFLSLVVISGPAWEMEIRALLEGAAVALAPGAVALLVPTRWPGRKAAAFTSVLLCAWVVSLLGAEEASGSLGLFRGVVLAPPWPYFCFLGVALVSGWAVVRARRGEWVPFRPGPVVRLLSAAMPWFCLIPLFAFARTSEVAWYSFVACLVVVGLLLMAVAVFSRPVGPLAAVGGRRPASRRMSRP